MPELNFDATQYPQAQQPSDGPAQVAPNELRPWELHTQGTTRPVDPMAHFLARLQPHLETMENESLEYVVRYEAYVLYCQERKRIKEEQLANWHKAVARIEEAKLEARKARELVSMCKLLETAKPPRKADWERN